MSEGISSHSFSYANWVCKTYNKEMPALQLGQKAVDSNDFYNSKRITDIDTLDMAKIVFSNKTPCNKERNQHYVVGISEGEEIVPFYIKTLL